MQKKLIQNIQEYRQWAWEIIEEMDNQHVDKALGLLPIRECWDVNENGDEVDEEGNIIPDDTAETVQIEDWVKELEFPLVAVYCFEKTFDRTGSVEIACAEFVSLKEFTSYEN
jgi:hypothetical protein